jgi:hypothetical protein
VKELTGFENALDGEKAKIKTFSKSLTDYTKEAYAKAQQLKKDKAKPAAIKHVEKMVTAASAFAKTMADLAGEADELVKKARLLFGAGKEGEADKALVQGLTQVKGKPGQFALAIGSKGAYLVAGPRLAPDALKQAKEETGGKFVRGDCEWSEEKKAYVFGLSKKPPGGLAKKIRKAILDQTLKKLQVKVLVRGPGGPEIDADTDADTMGAVDLEDAPEISAPPPSAPPPPAPPPPSQDSVVFTNRMRALSPAYIKAIQASPTSRAELDNLSGLATTAAKAGDYATALTRLDAYEAAIKKTLVTAAQRAPAPAPGPAGQAKPVRNVIFQQSRLLWEAARKKMMAELQTAEKKLLAHCQAVNDDPHGEVTYNLADVEAKSKQLYTILEKLDEQLIDKLDEALNAKTPELRTQKHQEAKVLITEYEREVTQNAILAAMQSSRVAQSNLRETIIGVLNGMKSKM